MTEAEPEEVSTEALAAALQQDLPVVDVREDFEYDEIHIPGCLHIPMGELVERRDELDTTKPVHVICAVGGRSLAAAKTLRKLGYEAVSVAGGVNLWASQGRETVSPKGK